MTALPPVGNRTPRRRLRPSAVAAVLLLVVPILEVLAIVAVGQAIGGWWTFALLVLMSMFGAWLIRREGSRSWRNLRDALAMGRMPARELADGVLVLVGGTLLLAPGFLTDAVGLLLVLPFSRPLMRPLLQRLIAQRLLVAMPTGTFPGRPTNASARPTAGGEVIEGEVIEGEVVEPRD